MTPQPPPSVLAYPPPKKEHGDESPIQLLLPPTNIEPKLLVPISLLQPPPRKPDCA